MPITAFYAALLTPVLIFLTLRTVARRRSARVALGDGGDADLLRRIRRHGNFVEYTPFALILLGLAESLGTMAAVLHAGGIALVAGRLLHAVALTQSNLRLRVAGMALTLAALAVPALACLVGAVPRLF
ncbi:MAPEG family protein [Aestuariivirga sp.]|uniref:MAPEG family protein n=1 Tax=Aestuariivirga sp. TaxID=2650926 RepID=UPI0039E5FE9C